MRQPFYQLIQCSLCLVSLMSAVACAGAPAATPTPEPVVDVFTLNQRLARTVNLGNALEAPTEGEWGMTLEEKFFTLIHEAGFTAVRVPIRWNAHAAHEAPYTIEAQFFERIDWVVAQALANNLAVILNIHHYEEMARDPQTHQERFLALWQQIAEHYQSASQNVVFELLNEPNGALGATRWNALVADVLPVVRATNPTRAIIVGPVEWNNLRALPDLELPADDPHLIVTFHYYTPFQFTHQGAEWVQGSEAWLGTTWAATSPQKQSVTFDLDRVAQWAKDNQRPIFMGEFGAYSRADLDSRALWTAFVAGEAEKRGFSWGYWEFGAGFGVYNRETQTWNAPLLKALMADSP